MNIFTDIVVGVLSAFLAVTNGAAHLILSAIEPERDETAVIRQETTEEKPDEKLSNLPSRYEIAGAIPQILIDNAAYQRAAVVESIQPEEATSTALQALINIYCTYRTDEVIRTTTGTGFFIDTQGVILTNAHVAQFLLLEGVVGETECIARAGNPAEPAYELDLLYIPPAWIREHADKINTELPKGTGERDYALLYVTSGLDGEPMPGQFPALPFDTRLLTTGRVDSEAYVAGYPANTLLENGGQSPLIPKLATTSVTELMTFGSNFADVFSISGTDVGERGSSGGPVVDKDGFTIGLVSTRGDDEQFGAGSLRAITISYIDRTIREETGFNLRQNAGGDLPYRARIFRMAMIPFLQFELEQQFD